MAAHAFVIPFDLPFDAAVALARSMGVVLAPEYYAMAAEKRAQAFTVSNLAKLDQVQAVADQLAKMHAQGGTFAEFQRWAKTQDWSLPAHRLETIYRNAAQTAYMAGHWRSFEESKDALPYLMYDAINDSRTRPSHLALDGVIKPVGDAFWKSHACPNGHRCRCSIRALSREEAQRRGGVTQNVPAEGGADAGWGQDPREWTKTLRGLVQKKRSVCNIAEMGINNINQPLWCFGPGAELAQRLDYALQVGKRSRIEPLAMQYRILTYIQQAEASRGQIRGQMTIGDFALRPELLELIADRTDGRGDRIGERAMLINRVAIQASYLLHIKQQHGPGGVKADRGIVTPTVILQAQQAAQLGEFENRVELYSAGNLLVSTIYPIAGDFYRFVWEVKPGRKSLTLFNLYPLKSAPVTE